MRKTVVNLRNLLRAAVLTFAVISVMNVNDISAKTKPVVNTKSMVIYEQTEQQIETNLKNNKKIKQTVSYKITEGKNSVNVIKDGSGYYIKGIKPGNGKVKVTVKTVKKVTVKNSKGKPTKKKQTSKKDYIINVTVLNDDKGVSNELLFNKITNGIKSAPHFKIHNFNQINWNLKNKSIMNSLDYIYSHMKREMKEQLLGFDYTYEKDEEPDYTGNEIISEWEDENGNPVKIVEDENGNPIKIINSDGSETFIGDTNRQFTSATAYEMSGMSYKCKGSIDFLLDDFIEKISAVYSVSINFKDKEITKKYNAETKEFQEKIRFKNYFVYQIANDLYQKVDKSVTDILYHYNPFESLIKEENQDFWLKRLEEISDVRDIIILGSSGLTLCYNQVCK